MEKTNQPQDEKKDSAGSAPRRPRILIKRYVVKSGDTLSSIAEEFYGDQSLYVKIYDANKDLIGNDPNDIKVGMELKIPPK